VLEFINVIYQLGLGVPHPDSVVETLLDDDKDVLVNGGADTKMYLSMAELTTQPSSWEKNSRKSVPPPRKLMRKGV
jgi:hypothetical protein